MWPVWQHFLLIGWVPNWNRLSTPTGETVLETSLGFFFTVRVLGKGTPRITLRSPLIRKWRVVYIVILPSFIRLPLHVLHCSQGKKKPLVCSSGLCRNTRLSFRGPLPAYDSIKTWLPFWIRFVCSNSVTPLASLTTGYGPSRLWSFL